MKRALGIALVVAMATGCVGGGASVTDADLSRLLLGRWLPRHGTKFQIFYPDGRWAVQRHETAEPYVGDRRWSLRGRTLTTTFEGRPSTETIVSISGARMVTYVVPGENLIYDRVP